jgi:5-methylcytosine-specific restriction endonuclease McrA
VKTCSVCRESKPLDQFPCDRKRNLKGMIYPRCRDCRHSYYLNNRDHCVNQMKEYRQRNRVKLCEKAKLYSRRRFFYIRARNLATRHPDEPTASHRELAMLWKRQKGICPFTGIRLNKYNAQLDHIVPLVNGGKGTSDNLRWVQSDVNYAKRDLSDTKFIALCHLIAARKSNKQGDL